jgi:hypothetical protein
MVDRLRGGALIAGTGVLLGLTGLAQADSNEVFIGQTGVTNVISITQTGLSNQVGANTTRLLLNQDGRANRVDIDQTGWANRVATVVHQKPEDAPYPASVAGFNQVGNENTLTVTQKNGDPAGFNTIEAVYQRASRRHESPSNELTVTQTGGGASEQRVGEVLQINLDVGADPNTVTITQTDGGAGVGNNVDSVRHAGHGNAIAISQSQTSNDIWTVRQTGDDNRQTLAQHNGSGNVVDWAIQFGDRNVAAVTQTGNANYTLAVIQNNAAVRVHGNRAALVLAGDDNGGDKRGGLGRFETVAKDVGPAQATLTQLGDNNGVSYTVAALTEDGVTAASGHNLYGFYQDGTGNHVGGITQGNDNEAAVAQRGDGNAVDFEQAGTGNAVAVSMGGDDNRADISQDGTGNIAHLAVGGASSDRSDRNNRPGLSFSGPLLTAAQDNGLKPGRFVQSGQDNRFDLTITSGGDNAHAFLQSGTSNTITGFVSGSFNQAVVIQVGMHNEAGFLQDGHNNHLSIQQ